MANPLRLGAVPYLNAKPLIDALRDRPDVTLSYATPSRIGKALRSGKLEAGLLPSLELAAHPGSRAVDGVAIASDGPVRSVLLFSRRPLKRIRRLGLDPASRSSNALVRILLAEAYGVKPEILRGKGREGAEAILLIGDAALQGLPGPWEEVLDLGAAWKKLSGLPFVYALWAGRALSPAAADLLREAKRKGTARLEAIARTEAPASGIPAGKVLRYLSESIRYELGRREREGMQAFFSLARAQGLLRKASEPTWL